MLHNVLNFAEKIGWIDSNQRLDLLRPEAVEMNASHIPDLFAAGTSEGAKKAWETRRRNAAGKPQTTPHPKKVNSKSEAKKSKEESKSSANKSNERKEGVRPKDFSLGTSLDRNPGESISAHLSRIADAAKKSGDYISPQERKENFQTGYDQGGAEHSVYIKNGRVYKITRAQSDGIGINSSASEYLERMKTLDEAFPKQNYRVHGITSDLRPASISHGIGIVTSMDYVEGEHPEQHEVDKFLKKSGFKRSGDGSTNIFGEESADWSNGKYKITDAHNENFIKTKKGKIVPIDINISKEDAS